MGACKPVMESLQDRDGMASTEDSQAEFRYVDDLLLNLENNNNSTDSHLGITDYDSTRDAEQQGQRHRSETIHPLESFPGADTALSRWEQKDLVLLFNWCVREVCRLQTQRDELIAELRQRQEPMVRAVKHLRGQLEETQRLLTLVQLDYVAVHEEAQQVKRKLFSSARDCIRSQVTLAAQEYEVAQSTVTQEELNSRIEGLTQELLQLREAHRNQVNDLRDRARAPCRPRTMSDVSHCRRASVSLQRRLSGSMRALEGWYEPRIMTLLKRQQFVEEALRRSQELGRDLKVRLGPLREETRKLALQKASLEQRIYLMEREREENITQYKETVGTLEEILRELKNEFTIQRASKEHLEELKDGLSRELVFLRGCDEPRETTEL